MNIMSPNKTPATSPNSKYIQFRVVSDEYREIFDKEDVARRAYGKQKIAIREEEEGLVELFARTSHDGSWILIQEFQLGSGEDEDEDED
jgi:hypothetical protein